MIPIIMKTSCINTVITAVYKVCRDATQIGKQNNENIF